MNTKSACRVDRAGHTETALPQQRAAAGPLRRRLIIDAPTRAMHWLLAAAFAGAWFTAAGEDWRLLHLTLGYLALGLLALRLAWPLMNPRTASLATLAGRVRGLGPWWASVRRGQAQHAAGYGGANALAIMLILLLTAGAALSGVVMDRLSAGFEDLADALSLLHTWCADAAAAVVLTHLVLVLTAARRLRNQRVRAMLTGRVPGHGPDLIPDPQSRRAWCIVGCAAAFLLWQAWAGPWRLGVSAPATAPASSSPQKTQTPQA